MHIATCSTVDILVKILYFFSFPLLYNKTVSALTFYIVTCFKSVVATFQFCSRRAVNSLCVCVCVHLSRQCVGVFALLYMHAVAVADPVSPDLYFTV